LRVFQERRFTSSSLSVETTLSQMALSRGSPPEPMLASRPGSRSVREEKRGVLRAAVGVMDQPPVRTRSRDRDSERVDELGSQVLAHRPADDRARARVHDQAQEE
jgi:hypothetical protein